MDAQISTKPLYRRIDLVNKWSGYKESLVTQKDVLPKEIYEYS